MPKNIYTPRDQLVCGKLDRAFEIARKLDSTELVYLLDDIRHDCIRMEQKLISRKDEVAKLKSRFAITRVGIPPTPEVCKTCGRQCPNDCPLDKDLQGTLSKPSVPVKPIFTTANLAILESIVANSLDISETICGEPLEPGTDINSLTAGSINMAQEPACVIEDQVVTCEHCGGVNIILDCIRCGAPVCCKDCCEKDYRERLESSPGKNTDETGGN